MKNRGGIMGLIVVMIALSTVSCVSIRPVRTVTLNDVSKMPPFDATVESVEIDHPFFLYTAVDIGLRKADGGYRLDLAICPANKFVVGFARSLHKGQRYSFPQVFADYVNNEPTNTVNAVKH